MTVTAQKTHRTVEELKNSFQAFNQISTALEKAYDRLRRQAAEIDIALAESNKRLAEKVQQLDETSGHLSAVVESMQAGVVVTDQDDRITLVNRVFEELVGRSAEDLRGKDKNDLVDDQKLPICCGDSSLLLRNIRLHGKRQVLRSRISPVQDSHGNVLGQVETLIDDTEVEELRRELRHRETFSALGEMAAGIAHEIRNPMVAIEGFAALLLRSVDQGNEAAKEHAERIILGVRRANSIITNLLCFAKPEQFQPRRVSARRILRQLRATLAATYPMRTSVHIQEPTESDDVALRCDPELIERLLVNLIENARDALKDSGAIQVSCARCPEGVKLIISDDGPGIPKDIREKMFLPFVTSRADGTGLGLSIVHRIVDLHKGRIAVNSQNDTGTTFEITLPAEETKKLALEEKAADDH